MSYKKGWALNTCLSSSSEYWTTLAPRVDWTSGWVSPKPGFTLLTGFQKILVGSSTESSFTGWLLLWVVFLGYTIKFVNFSMFLDSVGGGHNSQLTLFELILNRFGQTTQYLNTREENTIYFLCQALPFCTATVKL